MKPQLASLNPPLPSSLRGITLGLVAFLGFITGATPALAEIVTKKVTYEYEGVTFEGTLAWDEAVEGERPGVLIVPNWMGPSEYFDHRAKEIAALGTVAFVVDMYGVEVRPKNTEEASAAATALRQDVPLMRNRMARAMRELQEFEKVDVKKIAAMGYCFGGGCSLELARAGAPILGAISFHGNLNTPDPSSAERIRGKVLVFHGNDDPYVPRTQVLQFFDEMRSAQVDYQFIAFGNAVHSFTNPKADSEGARYHKPSAKRSWAMMKLFFEEIFAEKQNLSQNR